MYIPSLRFSFKKSTWEISWFLVICQILSPKVSYGTQKGGFPEPLKTIFGVGFPLRKSLTAFIGFRIPPS